MERCQQSMCTSSIASACCGVVVQLYYYLEPPADKSSSLHLSRPRCHNTVFIPSKLTLLILFTSSTLSLLAVGRRGEPGGRVAFGEVEDLISVGSYSYPRCHNIVFLPSKLTASMR